MTKSKKLPVYVTEARLATLLSRFAKAADAALGVKMQDMEERLRAELTVVVPPKSACPGDGLHLVGEGEGVCACGMAACDTSGTLQEH